MDDDKRIGVVATLKASEGQEAALLSACLEVAAASRTESGCLMYEVHLDAEDANSVVLFERWKDDVSLANHMSMAHSQKFMKAIRTMLAAPPAIRRLRPRTSDMTAA